MSPERLKQLGFQKRPLLKVIRSKCLDCCANSSKEVELCQSSPCELWPYRFGRDPFKTYELSDEQRSVRRESLQRAHKKDPCNFSGVESEINGGVR